LCKIDQLHFFYVCKLTYLLFSHNCTGDPKFEETLVTTGEGIKIENEIGNSSNNRNTFSQITNEKLHSNNKKSINDKISSALKTNCIRDTLSLNNGFDDDSICDHTMTMKNDISNTKSASSSKFNSSSSGNYLWPGNLPETKKAKV